MPTLKRESLLTILVVVLVLLNLGTLAFIIWNRPHPPQTFEFRVLDTPPEERADVPDSLHFTPAQQEALGTIESENLERLTSLDSQYRATIHAYVNQLHDSVARLKDSLVEHLGSLAQLKARAVFANLRALRDLCTPEQRAKFFSLLPLAERRFLPRSPRDLAAPTAPPMPAAPHIVPAEAPKPPLPPRMLDGRPANPPPDPPKPQSPIRRPGE